MEGKKVVAEWRNRGKGWIKVYSDGSFDGSLFSGWRESADAAIAEMERDVATGYHGPTMKRVVRKEGES